MCGRDNFGLRGILNIAQASYLKLSNVQKCGATREQSRDKLVDGGFPRDGTSAI